MAGNGNPSFETISGDGSALNFNPTNGTDTSYTGYSLVDKVNSIKEYELPTASETVIGGIKIGTNLTVDKDGILTSNFKNDGSDNLDVNKITSDSGKITSDGTGKLTISIDIDSSDNSTLVPNTSWIKNQNYISTIEKDTSTNFKVIDLKVDTNNRLIYDYKDNGSSNQTCALLSDIPSTNSDPRLKVNMKLNNESILDSLKDIKIYSFDWIKDSPIDLENNLPSQSVEYGFNANELEKIWPDSVDSSGNYSKINVLNIIGRLTKLIQELNERIELLEKE